ncbi:MAG: hypothetical protein HYX28_03535 [Candidatus Koribacter versatilis]|uniref:Uncharacterized protein n=1 Tax=Candidatus Korobacter versatilis TaxID=658062 RepID=A0A932EPL6_9BACT|nr:hypothetical protein [Candidatus Koribacter versatilis]
MAELVDLAYRRIRGTKEWKQEQERVRAAWGVIEERMMEMGVRPLTLEGNEPSPAAREEHSRFLAAIGITLKPAEAARAVRAARLMRLLAEHGQVSRAMCQERRADGRQCRYPVSEGEAMCRAHAEWKAGALGLLPFPDDALGLQRLMAKLLSGLLYEGMDAAKARVAADVCRTMRQNLERCALEADQAEREFFL